MLARPPRPTARAHALSIVEMLLYTGMPVHPRTRDRLREIIGETTPEEEAMLRSYRQAGEAVSDSAAG